MAYHPAFAELLEKYLASEERSQSWLAQRIGVRRVTVNRWLNLDTRPADEEMVVRIADAFGLRIEECDELLESAGYSSKFEGLRGTKLDQDTEQAINAIYYRTFPNPSSEPSTVDRSDSNEILLKILTEIEWISSQIQQLINLIKRIFEVISNAVTSKPLVTLSGAGVFFFIIAGVSSQQPGLLDSWQPTVPTDIVEAVATSTLTSTITALPLTPTDAERVVAVPTATESPSSTETSTTLPTQTPTITATFTPIDTPTETPDVELTVEARLMADRTAFAATQTASFVPNTATPTPSNTPTKTPTETPHLEQTVQARVFEVQTASAATETANYTPDTVTPTPSDTPIQIPTLTSTNIALPTATFTTVPTPTKAATSTPTDTPIPATPQACIRKIKASIGESDAPIYQSPNVDASIIDFVDVGIEVRVLRSSNDKRRYEITSAAESITPGWVRVEDINDPFSCFP